LELRVSSGRDSSSVCVQCRIKEEKEEEKERYDISYCISLQMTHCTVEYIHFTPDSLISFIRVLFSYDSGSR